jgi:hypothetical protein
MLNKEATTAYKKMANIHFEEEILHAYQLMHKEVITINGIFGCSLSAS